MIVLIAIGCVTLVVIGEDGRVAYKGGTGPFNFNPDELEAWLEENI